MMAIRVLLDCGSVSICVCAEQQQFCLFVFYKKNISLSAHEENIIAVTLFASKYSLMTLKEIFPRVTICAGSFFAFFVLFSYPSKHEFFSGARLE